MLNIRIMLRLGLDADIGHDVRTSLNTDITHNGGTHIHIIIGFSRVAFPLKYTPFQEGLRGVGCGRHFKRVAAVRDEGSGRLWHQLAPVLGGHETPRRERQLLRQGVSGLSQGRSFLFRPAGYGLQLVKAAAVILLQDLQMEGKQSCKAAALREEREDRAEELAKKRA